MSPEFMALLERGVVALERIADALTDTPDAPVLFWRRDIGDNLFHAFRPDAPDVRRLSLCGNITYVGSDRGARRTYKGRACDACQRAAS